MVAPDLQGGGLGRRLLAEIEALASDEAASYVLFTGAGSTRNQRMYKKAGYRTTGPAVEGVVTMVKRRIRDGR
jgi:tRNA (guanine37-N1)-methyltransferase